MTGKEAEGVSVAVTAGAFVFAFVLAAVFAFVFEFEFEATKFLLACPEGGEVKFLLAGLEGGEVKFLLAGLEGGETTTTDSEVAAAAVCTENELGGVLVTEPTVLNEVEVAIEFVVVFVVEVVIRLPLELTPLAGLDLLVLLPKTDVDGIVRAGPTLKPEF